jgi:site-specific DNA-cytosine methylase
MSEAKCEMVGMLDIKALDCVKRVYSPDGIAPTLTASQGGQRQVKIFDFEKYRVRKLTPTEYGRLQAFPMENWSQVVSDSQAYKQFGNAVTTTLFSAIAEQIKISIMDAKGEKQEAFTGMNTLETDAIINFCNELHPKEEEAIE